MNRVYLIGRLTKDLELKTTSNELSVVSFSLAVENYGKDQNGEKKPATFIPCVAWGKQAENLVKYNKKGSILGIEGRIVLKEFQRKDGNMVRYLEVNCETIQFLNPKQKEEITPNVFDEDILEENAF